MSVAVEAVPSAALPVSSVTEDTHELTTQEVHAALSDLGYNHSGELVYKQCILSFKRLSRLSGLERYSNLQHLVLDNNALTELTAVQHMPQLVYLSARHNKLTSDIFDSLAGTAGCLERLHLDANCLTSLNGLEALPYLTDVTCNENQIECISVRCLSSAQRLMRLRLNHNRISSVDVCAFDAVRLLRTLELGHNALTRVEFLSSVSAQLEQLVLADNHIKHLDNAVQHLKGLAVLDVRRNELSGLAELQVLRTLTTLRILFFDGNENLVRPLQRTATSPTVDYAVQLPSVDRTEYHAEVVMSDEENEEGVHADLRASETGASSYADERSIAANSTDTRAADAKESGGRLLVADNSQQPVDNKCVGGNPFQRHPLLASSSAAVAAAAAPTTASYVALAATETHGFIRTVGSAARDAVLCVKVDNAREILTLPEEEQVYLWTLSVLPHLLEVNGRSICSADVARAHFLFSTDAS